MVMDTRKGLQGLLELAKESGQGQLCPFTPQSILCLETACGDCEIRKAWEREEDHRIAENLKDYWRHLNSGAEKSW
jgi:hypothetical protein